MKSLPQAIDAKLKILARSWIELSAADAFSALSDVDYFLYATQRYGAEVRPILGATKPGGHGAWNVTVHAFRRKRSFELIVNELDPDGLISITCDSKDYNVLLRVFLKPRSETITDVELHIAANPKTIAARLTLHAFKLRKNRIRRRIERNMRRLFERLEQRYIVTRQT